MPRYGATLLNATVLILETVNINLLSIVQTMAFAGHHHDHALGAKENGYGDYEKPTADHISDLAATRTSTGRRREAPPLIRDLSPDDRERLERALVRKIDFRLLPMIILMYILNYLDRNNIASARLAGLETDLKLSSVQYNTSVSILFVGYLLMQGRISEDKTKNYIQSLMSISSIQSFLEQNWEARPVPPYGNGHMGNNLCCDCSCAIIWRPRCNSIYARFC